MEDNKKPTNEIKKEKKKLSKGAKIAIIVGSVVAVLLAVLIPVGIWGSNYNAVSNISLDQNTVNANVNESFALNAITDPINADAKNITWESLDTSVIKVVGTSAKECSFLALKEGNTKVVAKLTNGRAQTECSISVDPAISSITAVAPSKTTYKVGEAFSSEGTKVNATFINGETKEYTTGVSCSILDGYVFTNADLGSFEVTVTYKEFASSFLLTVEKATLTSISIESLPTYTSYIVGETLNTNGLIVNANYSDGSSVKITNYDITMEGRSTDPRIIPFTASEVGNKTVTVTYKVKDTTIEKSTTFTITIQSATLASISINKSQEQYRTAFYIGEYLDLTGLQVTANYSDGTTKNVTDSVKQINTDPVNPDVGIPKVGSEIKSTHDKSFVVTLSYLDKTDTTENVQIKEGTLDSLTIVNKPTKESYKAGEALDLSGIKAVANFSDGTQFDFSENIALYDLSYPLSGYVFAQKDVKASFPITIYYGNKETTFNVEVKMPDVVDIVLLEPSLLSYSVGETLNLNGMQVTALYSDGTTSDVTSNVTVTPENGYKFVAEDVKDNYEVKVSFGGATKSFFVKVAEAYIKDIELYEPTQVSYKVGNAFVLTGMHVYAVYSDDSKKEVTGFVSSSVKEGYVFQESDVGEKNVSITYATFTKQFKITVENATIENVVISQNPHVTTFAVGDHFDSTGLTLKLTYSDGKEIYVNDGYTTNYDQYRETDYFHNANISSSTPVTVSYAGFNVTYNIEIKARELLVKDGANISKVYDEYTIHSDFDDANIRVDFSNTFPSSKSVWLEDENGNHISDEVSVSVVITRYRYDVHLYLTEEGKTLLETCEEVYLVSSY